MYRLHGLSALRAFKRSAGEGRGRRFAATRGPLNNTPPPLGHALGALVVLFINGSFARARSASDEKTSTCSKHRSGTSLASLVPRASGARYASSFRHRSLRELSASLTRSAGAVLAAGRRLSSTLPLGRTRANGDRIRSTSLEYRVGLIKCSASSPLMQQRCSVPYEGESYMCSRRRRLRRDDPRVALPDQVIIRS